MFENSGEKIKKIAVALFYVTAVLSIILAFVFGWEDEYHHYSYSYGGYTKHVFKPEIFFPLLIGVPVLSYISTLLIVAFGDLVQNSKCIKEVLEEMKDKHTT